MSALFLQTLVLSQGLFQTRNFSIRGCNGFNYVIAGLRAVVPFAKLWPQLGVSLVQRLLQIHLLFMPEVRELGISRKF